jgi:TP901 family phage tail tape measure protein
MIVFKIRVDDQGTAHLDKIGNKAKALELQFGKTSGILTKAFQGVAMYAGISAFISALGNASKEMDTFHLNLRKIEQVGGVSGKGLGIITEQMKKLALNTEFTHTQISAAGVTLSRMGINTAETMGKILPNAMNLATVAGEELTLSAQGLAQIFNIFNIQGDDTTVVTNKIGVALNKTALDLKGYIEAMQYAGGAAGATKTSFDDITAAIAFLSQRAIIGSRAGTTMKNVLISMVKPGSEAAKALKSSGLAANDLVGLFKLLNEKGVGIDKIVKMFGMWATPGALGLQQGAKSFQQLRDEITKGNSDIAKQARIIREENLPAYQQMMNAVTNLGMTFGEALGFKKGDIWRALKEKLIELAGYVKENEEQFRALGSALKDIGKIALNVSSWGLGKHFAEISATLGVIFGVKMLSSIGLFKVAITQTGIQIGIMGTALKTALSSTNLLVAAAILLADTFARIPGETDKIVKSLGKNRASEQYMKDIREMYTILTATGTFSQKENVAHYSTIAKKKSEMQRKYGIGVNYADPKALEQIMINDSNQRSFAEANAFNSRLAARNVAGNSFGGGGNGGNGGETVERKTIDELMKMGVLGELGTKWDNGEMEGLNNVWNILPANRKNTMIHSMVDEKLASGVDTNDIGDFSASDALISAPGFAQYGKGGKLSAAHHKMLGLLGNNSDKLDEEEKRYQELYQAMGSMANESATFIAEMDNRKHEKILANISKEQDALTAKYDLDVSAAGDNLFKRAMIEQKYQAQKDILERKAEAQKKEMAKNELNRAKIQASVAFALTVLGVMKADSWKGFPTILTSMLGITAAALPLVTALTAKSYKEGGIVSGNGNSSSDSEWARVSRGERILSVSELSKLGGNERVQQMLDRNSISNRNVNININTMIGTKPFVREMITTMKEELCR